MLAASTMCLMMVWIIGAGRRILMKFPYKSEFSEAKIYIPMGSPLRLNWFLNWYQVDIVNQTEWAFTVLKRDLCQHILPEAKEDEKSKCCIFSSFSMHYVYSLTLSVPLSRSLSGQKLSMHVQLELRWVLFLCDECGLRLFRIHFDIYTSHLKNPCTLQPFIVNFLVFFRLPCKLERCMWIM